MIIPMNVQVNIIVNSMLAGMLTGILFDIYRIIRGFENPNVIVTLIEDTLFWILAGILVFIFLLYNTYVYIGPYLFLYIALGLYIYLKFLSRYFLKAQYKIILVTSKVWRILKNLILYPIELMMYKIIRKNK